MTKAHSTDSTRTAKEAVRVRARLLVSVAMLLLFVAFTGTAAADKTISEAGEGAGQTLEPRGLATDFETGRLFVADQSNNRIDVFAADGSFERAFGWGVKDGKAALEVCTTECRKGLAGSGAGQLNAPTAIAVDNTPASASRHSVYVVDAGNSRIEKFGPEGEFKLAFGSAGEAEGQFSGAGRVRVGVGPAGTLYVLDSIKAGSEFEHRLQKFEPSGVEVAPQHLLVKQPLPATMLAVASNGDFYVSTSDSSIRKYDASGGFLEEVENVFEDLFEGKPSKGPYGLAVDGNDNLLVVSSESGPKVSVLELDPAGNRVRRFGFGAFSSVASAVAPDPAGTGVYASEAEGNRVLDLDFPPAGPLVLSRPLSFPEPCTPDPLGNIKATLNAEVNPEGKATTVHFQYVDQHSYETEEGFKSPNTKTTAESESVGSDFTLHKVSVQATGLSPETAYRCRAIATNPDAPAGNPGKEGAFVTRQPFEILETSASAVGTEAATLNATVNPLGIPTKGYFEYVDDATYQADVAELGPGHGFDHAARAPQAPDELDFGAGETPKLASAQILGLTAATLYHFRIRVDNHLTPVRTGPERTLRTFGALTGLPDARAYELVSPNLKNSAELAVPSIAGGIFNKEVSVRINAAAASGEAVTYTSWTSFGQAGGAPSASQYLSKRTPAGWGTENVSPGGFLMQPLTPPYRGFSPDLRFGAFYVSEPALTPDAQEGFQNLYLRDNQSGQVRALTIAAPQVSGVEGFCASYAGASADGTQAIFAANGALSGTGAPSGEGFSLYQWSASGNLALVSVFPDGEPAPPVKSGPLVGTGTGFGGVGGNCTMDQAPIRNAISADGSTIFWAYGGKYKSSERPLFAHIGGSETVQLDAKSAGEKSGGGGKFWAATGDGSDAFFTAPGKLTGDAKAKGQLYRFETQSRTRTDLTPGTVDPEVLGVIGISEDGSYVYFVAKGALTGEEENAAHQKAQTGLGAHNLYLWHEGEGLRFIAALSELDQRDWETAPERLFARVTPDGKSLAFLSVETQALSGYDNRIAAGTACQPGLENTLEGDPRCAEAYLYDAASDSLACASCNPSGSRPLGPTELPGWTNPYEGPHYLSADGSKLFFESRDALSAADQNAKRDVYEFERPGSGSCSASSPSYNPVSGGCLFPISSGTSSDESYLVDASADGRDVFFTTRSALSGWDKNENYDVYDARVGGGFPEPPPPPPRCTGEACPAPPSQPPPSAASATPNFQGPGNPPQKQSKHKKQRKKHKHKAKKHKRTPTKGRAKR